ncbi:MAG TPA: EamA family transporter [Desulfotomaculum sp.]|nr:MAG: transporter [Desulfotomaculum sp. BICA1-6]HBX24644.1 EamA family transporter [Desulfotomaculum sp.]
MSQNKTYLGPLLVLSGAVLWGTTGTTQALAPEGATPLAIGAMRLLVGGLCLLAIALFRQAFKPGGYWPTHLVAVTAISMAAYQPFFFGGVAKTGVAVGTVVGIGSAPIMAGILVFLFRGERPGKKWLVSTLLAITGCYLLFTVKENVTVNYVGVLMSLGAGLAYASYVVFSKSLLDKNRPEAVIAVVFCISALLLLPILITQPLNWLLEWRGVAVALHLGIVATAIAYFLFSKGLSLVPAATAVTLTLAEPLTAATLGVTVLGERLTAPAFAGIGLLLLGILILSVSSKKRPAHSKVNEKV